MAATCIYRAIMLECERQRAAIGISMEKFSEYAGLPDRYYAKALHCDTASGKQASWPSLQIIVDALFPNGFDVIIRAKPGQVIDPENLKAKLLQIKALKDPKTQRELMRELGARGGRAGGKKRWARIGAKARSRMMRRLAERRWDGHRTQVKGA